VAQSLYWYCTKAEHRNRLSSFIAQQIFYSELYHFVKMLAGQATTAWTINIQKTPQKIAEGSTHFFANESI